MVKPTADRKREQLEWPINDLRFRRGIGTVALQSLMGPVAMVVLRNVFAEQIVQVTFTEHDDVIEQFPA